MKSMKKIILSALLFAFTMSVMHDYVIVNIDTDTQSELLYSSLYEVSMDSASQLHDNIHRSLDVFVVDNSLVNIIVAAIEPFNTQKSLVSYIHLVPQRPPLAQSLTYI